MNCLWIIVLVTAHTLIVCHASPTGAFAAQNGGVVEIEKQKLIKFPEDVEQQQRQDQPDPLLKQKKEDEAKRILEEIEKINQSLGYKKKQTEQAKRVPSILDSSQYLFPKPAYQPFHAQSHQFPGSNGEVLLVPSIRAIKFDRKYASAGSKLLTHNVPQERKSIIQNIDQEKSHPQKSQSYFRPNQVQLPAPQNVAEQQQLPTHFVIPVRLYKMNKEEYMKQFTPQQYRIKGYKIVGDIDNFYGKAKKTSKPSKHKNGNKSNSKQSSPKYHLFLLPREVALNEDSNSALRQIDQIISTSLIDAGSREEKLANRPFKVQTTATSGNTASGSNVTSSTQIVRKRIIPKPLRNKETNINSLATQQLSDGSSASSATTIHIAPPTSQNAAVSIPSSASSLIGSTINSGIINAPQPPNKNKNSYSLLNNRPSIGFLMNTIRPLNDNNNNNGNGNGNNNFGFNNATNATTANAIKMAFQNIFKFPFRQELKPDNPNNDESSVNLQSVPLQIPQKTFPLFPQSFYQSDVDSASTPQLPHQISTHNYDKDYKWDDEGNNSNTDDDNDSTEEVEKQLFGHRHHQQQETQKEAIKQGGIIIQKLKVRKGGIAIAGPGGVATAGSGGTAIVGPGGYALTHPRSLTIAGPGAKVIAIPADVDLKDALQRTNLNSKSFPREGKIVATGPTVYYSPATGTAADV